MACFEKDGRVREASTPVAAVKLRSRGWKEVPVEEPEPETGTTSFVPFREELPSGETDD